VNRHRENLIVLEFFLQFSLKFSLGGVCLVLLHCYLSVFIILSGLLELRKLNFFVFFQKSASLYDCAWCFSLESGHLFVS